MIVDFQGCLRGLMASTDSVPLAPAKENVVNPIPPLALALLSICLLVWVISLFLPAATTMTWNGEQSSKGSDLAIASAIFFWVPVFGWASLANVFMLISPFEIKRVRRGKGRVFACLFLLFAVIPMAIAFPVRGMLNPGEVRTLETGFYVWQASLLGAANWFLWAVWRKSYVWLAGALLLGLLTYAPTYQNRIRFREIVEKTRGVIDTIGVSRKNAPIGDLNMAQYRDLWRLRNDPARAELVVAVDYTQNAVACWDRERISDLNIAQMYPGLHLQPPDPSHTPQPPPSGRNAMGCFEDKSATAPWYSGVEMRQEALRRATLHLANAEVEIGLESGSVQEPFPLSPHESFFLNRAKH
jgi:hypothetical protein